jgi:hypothetical protein
MKHVVILLIVAATVAGCAHRYSRYGYQPPANQSQEQK